MGGILLLIKYLLVFVNLKELNAKEAVFVEEFSVAGSLNSIKNYWEKLTAFDPKYDYFPKPAKSYLIVKEQKLMEAWNLFNNSRVNITAEGKSHLGGDSGSAEYRDDYVKKFSKRLGQPTYDFANYAETQPQATYLAFTIRFKKQI